MCKFYMHQLTTLSMQIDLLLSLSKPAFFFFALSLTSYDSIIIYFNQLVASVIVMPYRMAAHLPSW